MTPEEFVDSLADHPAVVDGTWTARELAERLVTYKMFWDIVQGSNEPAD